MRDSASGSDASDSDSAGPDAAAANAAAANATAANATAANATAANATAANAAAANVSPISSASLSAMYQDVILRHYRAPHGRGVLPTATATAERRNPLCGDQIAVSVLLRDDTIVDIGFEGRGCSIATASASMLTDAVRGLEIADARLLAARVARLVRGEATPSDATPSDGAQSDGAQSDGAQSDADHNPAASEGLGDLQSLAGVTPYPPRHGCALMAWQALTEILDG